MKLVKRIVLAALFLLSGVVFAETPTKTVEAEGMGETLELAMKNARENAVRKAFGEVVDSVTEVKNDQLIESTISASSGFVVSSQVLGAQFDEKNKIYTVKTRTVVATERMKAQINRFKKSTASVDIGSMLEAADAKIQEKNAMKILLYLLDEIPKLYRLESHEIGIDADGRLWLKYHCDYDKEQLERVYKKAGDALRGNGYENDRGTIRFCEGSWVTNDFRNENVILFWNHKEHKDHPQNLYRFFPYDELIIKYAVMDAQSKILAEDSRGRIVEIVRGSPKDPSSIKFQPQSFSEQPTFDKLAGENLKKVAKIIFFVDYQCYKKSGKKYVFAEVPVNGNDLFAQFESKKSRAKQIVALWAKFDRDYYKTIQPKVEFKYNRVKQVIEFKIEYPVNMSMYVRNARALSKKLEDLGIGETGALDLTICKKGGDKLFDFRIPSDGKILDFYRAERDKYQYRLVINCKDRAGEVLQKVTLDLPEDVCPKKWRNTFSTYNPSTTRTYTKTAEFDIPEDLEKVASIETFIEERVEK